MALMYAGDERCHLGGRALMAKISTGPVVGKVTKTTARVLVDSAVPAQIRVALQAVLNPADAQAVILETTQERPVRVASFSNLTPGTAYAITLEVNGVVDDERRGRLNTLPDNAHTAELLVMSCCDADYQDAHDMHETAYRTHVASGSATLALHIGDQVYGDQTFHGCVAALKAQQAPAQWPAFTGWIKEQYRTLYRRTWNVPGIRKLLANTMNLMIWDDHEVTDDWADRGLFVDRNSAEHFVARCAWAVYREYQRQLWEDVNDAPDAPYGVAEHHAHAFDWLGVLFVDNRGGRAFRPAPALGSKPYLSPAQWGSIRAALGAGGTLANVRMLVVVTPVPLVFMGPKATANWDGDADDLWGHWSHDPYREEQFEMLELLRTWKGAEPRREVVVVGGDVHIGGLLTICHREHRLGAETPIFRELIASAVRRAPKGKTAFLGYSAGVKGDPLLFFQSPTFSYRVDDLRRRENFGVVTASIDAAGALHTELSVVEADE